jgi:hypothetical protein
MDLGHLAPASEVTGHSGTSSSKQLDINNFEFFFFILNININLCDDACEEKNNFKAKWGTLHIGLWRRL